MAGSFTRGLRGPRLSWPGWATSGHGQPKSITQLRRVRWLHIEKCNRLSTEWVPSGGIAATQHEDAHSKLVRAGFLRQAHSGLFHMLPLGRRVQDKIEALIDKHMQQLGASRVSLSSISSAALWEKSGRLQNVASELFRFEDRKEVGYLLSPTHEEEITTLVARNVKSYKELPLKLYQITRKYRDEFRPRQGLLRSREFIMKDMYTFDASVDSALVSYEQVRAAYAKFFKDLKLPILVAKASSGDMGGDLSHEFHLATSLGEDHVVSCGSCDYVINDELAEARIPDVANNISETNSLRVWRGISKDRSTLVNVWYPETSVGNADVDKKSYTDVDVNIYAVKSILPDLDAGVENPLPFWTAAIAESKATRVVNFVDSRLPQPTIDDISDKHPGLPFWPDGLGAATPNLLQEVVKEDKNGKGINLLRIREGDHCPKCSDGTLSVQKAIELGHTFHLGTRYSAPLQASVSLPASPLENTGGEAQTVPMQMGCHGIGVSRIIGAVADHLADEKGLNWPRLIAPYEVVVIPGKDVASGGLDIYSTLAGGNAELDVVLDDRKESIGWKLKDADLIGYPVIVVIGREWATSQRCEVQCRRLGVKENIGIGELQAYVSQLLEKL